MYDIKYFEEIFEKFGDIDDGKGQFSVLALIIMMDKIPHILFEVRAMNMRRQPGEVCFPGGKIENNETPAQCAVREAHEELGIESNRIHLIGSAGAMYSLLNEKVKLFVGEMSASDFNNLKPNDAEVHKVFLAPVDFFMERGPQDAYNYEGHYIWGLTARGVNKIIKMCREGLR